MDKIAYVQNAVGAAYALKTANCWHLTQKTLLALYGAELPMFGARDAVSRKARVAAVRSFKGWDGWQEQARPVDGAVLIMGRIDCLPDLHVGTWIDLGSGSGCLHTDSHHGAVFDDLFRLKMRGYDKIRFFTPK